MPLTAEQTKQFDDYYLPAPVNCPSCKSSDNVLRLVVGRPSQYMISNNVYVCSYRSNGLNIL